MNLGKMIDTEAECDGGNIYKVKLLDDEDDDEMVFINDFTEDHLADKDEQNKQKFRLKRQSSSYEVYNCYLILKSKKIRYKVN